MSEGDRRYPRRIEEGIVFRDAAGDEWIPADVADRAMRDRDNAALESDMRGGVIDILLDAHKEIIEGQGLPADIAAAAIMSAAQLVARHEEEASGAGTSHGHAR